ncbi:MAG TPA: sodium/solute symporter [Candidatus Aquicultor sp.]|jgi:cation/acetate symporter
MQTTLGQTNPIAIGFFLFFVLITLGITYWAAKKTKSAKEFYAAGRNITAGQNGLALAGDYMSAASFLGIAGMVSLSGFDGLIYAIGFLVGWPIVMFLIAEPLRNLGKYTFADVVADRLKQGPVRTAAAVSSVVVVTIYLIPQMVGSGTLITMLLGLPYEAAIVLVGALMIAYVLFGGMLSTTWVQIIKAGLLLIGTTVLSIMVLSHFHFSLSDFFGAAIAKVNSLTKGTSEAGTGFKMLEPGKLLAKPIDTISLSLALMFGTAGLPHILMRFYTVPDTKAARNSVNYGTAWIGYFYILTFIMGFGAASLVGKTIITNFDKKGNMAAPLLAEALGGPVFLGFISAVAFATILAVVSGLALSGASAFSHDLYANVFRKGKTTEKDEMRVAKIATVCFGIVAVALGILFKGQNVAYMVGLAFAVAASANFPAILMSIYWKKFSTAGAVASIWTGLILSVGLIILSPTVWGEVLGHMTTTMVAGVATPTPIGIFPLNNPAIISIPASFIVGIVFSLVGQEKEAEAKYSSKLARLYAGVGAE